MSTFYLVRHGITQANKENRFAGRTSEKLHVEGIEQIRQVGERLSAENITSIYCGPANRTVQSAEILGSLLKVPVFPIAEFDEIYIPHWDGLTKDEIRQQHGAQYPEWLSMPQTFNLPGCETLEQVQKRAVGALRQILSEGQKQNVLLVSHLIVLRCLVLYFKGLKIRDFRSIKIENGSILQVSEVEKGGGLSVLLEA
jgi:broad specificity phosphatase PhoE